MNEARPQSTKWQWVWSLLSVVACLTILGGASAGVYLIYQTEPTAQQIKATRKSAALVETVAVQRGTYSPRISVLGTIEPSREVILSPRVTGEVIQLSEKFVPGGRVEAQDLLLKIDPTDFENAVSIRESELEQVAATLRIEEGRQLLAQQEFELLRDTIEEMNRSLVLREPQVASIRAEVSVAKAQIQRAKIDLERTSIFAPFDAQILSRSVNVGSQVSRGEELARLVGVAEYWVMASVPIRSLRWIQFSDGEQPGSPVTLRDPDSWPPGVTRSATVSRLIGELDERTRLATVLVSVPDPLGQIDNSPPLILDSLIETDIEGRPMEDVVRVDRNYLRSDDSVWLYREGELEIRQIEVLYRDAAYAYISSGLDGGEEIVITNLATVANGIKLRKIDTAEASVNTDPSTGATN